MFVLFAIITATFMIAEPSDEPADIFARLGMPKLDTCQIQIHIGEGGEWTVQLVEAYSIEGVKRQDLADFQHPVVELDKYCSSRSSRTTLRKKHMQCRSKGECNDPLKLASLLVNIFEEEKCDFFRWDGKSFEWRSLRQAQLSPKRKEDGSVPDVAVGIFVETLVDQALGEFERELSEKGITNGDLEAASEEWADCKLVITTSGKIIADLPAEVSRDGKTMTLNLTKVLRDPPRAWSFRVINLQDDQATTE